MKDATGFNKSSLTAKKIALKVEVVKLEVDELNSNKLVNVPTGLNNLKAKEDDLDADKLKTVPADLKKKYMM